MNMLIQDFPSLEIELLRFLKHFCGLVHKCVEVIKVSFTKGLFPDLDKAFFAPEFPDYEVAEETVKIKILAVDRIFLSTNK